LRIEDYVASELLLDFCEPKSDFQGSGGNILA